MQRRSKLAKAIYVNQGLSIGRIRNPATTFFPRKVKKPGTGLHVIRHPTKNTGLQTLFPRSVSTKDVIQSSGNLPSEAVPGPKVRDMGGQFLPNRCRIERSRVFDIARHMPKGCHLHIHFNTELPPEKLLLHARWLQDTMFVRTTQPLLKKEDFEKAEIVFNVMPKTTVTASIFSIEYNSDIKAKGANPWMR